MMFAAYLVLCFLAISAKAQSNGVRLVNGNTLGEGRVEVLYDGDWGTVCDDGWGLEDANVVCRSLGLGNASEAVSFADFGQGTGAIVLDDVSCTGEETNIFDCGNAGLGINNCGHNEDAGVRCNNSVRLVEGSDAHEGRVEVYYNGAWGTICDDLWDDIDATVVCQSLGFGPGTAQGNAYFGQGSGDILLDDVSCSGSETHIRDCSNAGIGVDNCAHSEDAGVICSLTGGVRLVNGNTLGEGRVEVQFNRTWGTVCDDGWGLDDANVVCRSLGLGNASEAVSYAGFGQGTGAIVLDNVYCTGEETNIFDCGNAGLGIHNCGHHEDAGVRCQDPVRLVEGSDAHEGRVEVYYNGAWGTVCDDLWDDTDATVVCQSLGFGSGTAQGRAYFGQGSGDILLDDVTCSGSETDIRDCSNAGIGVDNCAHSEDAGVICSQTEVSDVRLADGIAPGEGRVEVFYNGAWGTVCDDGWDLVDANVVCQSLGYDSATDAFSLAEFGQGTGQIVLDDVSCSGDETSIFDCGNAGLGVNNCGHYEDASVRCQTVRLVDGACDREGRVEVFYDGAWGTVCDDLWDDIDATVVCQSLGYSSGTAVGSAEFGQGTGAIVLDNVQCSSDDTYLFGCQHNPFLEHNCSHGEDAGVRCTY